MPIVAAEDRLGTSNMRMSAPPDEWQVETLDVDLGPVVVGVATNAGPRVLSYRRPNGPEFLATLPSLSIDHPDVGQYRFLGGHRLWQSPEIPEISYQQDDNDVEVSVSANGVALVGPQGVNGVVKSIALRQEGDFTVVEHSLTNRGPRSVVTSPWAITQMKPGGYAVLPNPSTPIGDMALRPTRSLVVWPYTDLAAPEVAFEKDYTTIRASASASPTKLGQQNRVGWLAYVLAEDVFIKWSPIHDDAADYPDLGASTQCYRNEHFLELETVGPTVTLKPGQSTTHVEVWTSMPVGDNSVSGLLGAIPRRPEGVAL